MKPSLQPISVTGPDFLAKCLLFFIQCYSCSTGDPTANLAADMTELLTATPPV